MDKKSGKEPKIHNSTSTAVCRVRSTLSLSGVRSSGLCLPWIVMFDFSDQTTTHLAFFWKRTGAFLLYFTTEVLACYESFIIGYNDNFLSLNNQVRLHNNIGCIYWYG